MTATTVRPTPPACPDWCESSDSGWTGPATEPVKCCERTLPAGVDVDGTPVQVLVRRWAFLEPDGIEVCEPEIEVLASGRLDAANAAALADALSAVSTALPR